MQGWGIGVTIGCQRGGGGEMQKTYLVYHIVSHFETWQTHV